MNQIKKQKLNEKMKQRSKLLHEIVKKINFDPNLSFAEFCSLQDRIPKNPFLFLDFYHRGIVKRKMDGKKFVIVASDGETEKEYLYYLIDHDQIEEQKKFWKEKFLPQQALIVSRKEIQTQFEKPHKILSILDWQTEGKDWIR